MSIRNTPEDVHDLDRRYVFHPFTSLADHQRDGAAFVLTHGAGARLTERLHQRTVIEFTHNARVQPLPFKPLHQFCLAKQTQVANCHLVTRQMRIAYYITIANMQKI